MSQSGSMVDPNVEVKDWSCNNYDAVMDDLTNSDINKEITSANKKDSFTITTQKE